MEMNQAPIPSSEFLDSLWLANASPSFHGSASTMVINYDEIVKERSLFPQTGKEEIGNEELFEACFHQPEKKRRLSAGQVQFLERCFEIENKLEPDRKDQLAKELGLQPRQVSVWFQNRRARYKNKQLEKDYDLLKSDYDKLKSDYENLYKENEKLKIEVHSLNDKIRLRETRGEVNPETCVVNPINTVDAEYMRLNSNVLLENVFSRVAPNVLGFKQEAATSAKSDVFDSDSPHYADDSSNIYREDEIDKRLSKSLLCSPSFLKIEDDCYGDLQPNPSILGLNGEDPGTWVWNY